MKSKKVDFEIYQQALEKIGALENELEMYRDAWEIAKTSCNSLAKSNETLLKFIEKG